MTEKIYYVTPRSASSQEVREEVYQATGKSVLVTHSDRNMYIDQLFDVIDEADMMEDNGEWKQWWLNFGTAPHQPGEQPGEEALDGLEHWLRGYPLLSLEFPSHDVIHEELAEQFDHLYVVQKKKKIK